MVFCCSLVLDKCMFPSNATCIARLGRWIMGFVSLFLLATLVLSTQTRTRSPLLQRDLVAPTIAPRATVYYHAHLAKTAGSSLNRLIARRYYGVCGHKGYSFSQNFLDEARGKTDSAHPGYGLDVVHPLRMSEWGFHNCAFITHEIDWETLGTIANGTVWYRFGDGSNISSSRIPLTKLLIPCRDPVSHLLSQCNHAGKNFTKLSSSLGNCSAVIASCSVGWGRYDNRLLQYFDKIVLFKYDDFDSVIQFLDQSLPKRLFGLAQSSSTFFRSNKDRINSNEVFTPQCPEQELREALLQAWSYYDLCSEYLGSSALREYDASTLASNKLDHL